METSAIVVDTSWGLVSLIASDVLVYLTFPVHLRFLYVLLKKRIRVLDPSFQILLIHLTWYNILDASSVVFIRDPAAYGLVPEFYEAKAPWLGRIELIKATTLSCCMGFHVLLGLNRLTAFTFPIKQIEIWSPLITHVVCYLVWVVAVVSSIPIIVGDSVDVQRLKNALGVVSIVYQLRDRFYILPMLSLAYVFVFEATKIFTYIAILYKMKRYMVYEGQLQILAKHKFAENIKRMTFAAAVNSFGYWVNFLYFLIYYVYLWATERKLVDFVANAAILRVLSAINNVLTPWVMMATFKCIRGTFLGRKKKTAIAHTTPEPLVTLPLVA